MAGSFVENARYFEYSFPFDAQLITYGADSDVWRVGEEVVKVYDLLLTQILFYQEITNRAKAMIGNNPRRRFKIGKHRFLIDIVPVTRVEEGKTKRGKTCIFAWSPYVEGPNGQDLVDSPDNVFRHKIDGLSYEEQEFLKGLRNKGNVIRRCEARVNSLIAGFAPTLGCELLRTCRLNIIFRRPDSMATRCLITDIANNVSWMCPTS